MIDISEVKVGDRVQLTRKNEDGFEEKVKLVVTAVRGKYALESRTNAYITDYWDDMERLFPVKSGLYTPFVADDPDMQPVWWLCADGTWLNLPHAVGGIVYRLNPASVEHYLRAGTLRYLDLGKDT